MGDRLHMAVGVMGNFSLVNLIKSLLVKDKKMYKKKVF